MPDASGPVPTRRAVLLTSGAAVLTTGWLLSACDSSPSAEPSPGPGGVRSLDPVAEAQRRNAISDEHALITAYQLTGQRHPTLRGILAIPLAHHAAHLQALGASSTASATPVAPASGQAWFPPEDPLLAVRSLAAKELQVARSRRSACSTASGEWAGLLGSLGACEAGHAALLGSP